MKELDEYNFKQHRYNSKNIIQFGYFNNVVDLVNLAFLKETNLFNLNSYTIIELSLTFGGLKPSIGQLIKLPNINILNNSISNYLEISTGVVSSNYFAVISKADIYNYLKLFSSLDIVLESYVSLLSDNKVNVIFIKYHLV